MRPTLSRRLTPPVVIVALLVPLALLAEAPAPGVVLVEAPAGVAPGQVVRIEALGHSGGWQFQYDTGFVSETLYLPIAQVVDLRLRTVEPGYRLVVEDALDVAVPPGGPVQLWLEAQGGGRLALSSGDGVQSPRAAVQLLAPAGFRELVDTWGGARALTLGQRGELLYERLGCSSCHRLDGRAAVGGSPRGLWGTRLVMEDGESIDVSGDPGRAFLRESIVAPHARYTAGYMSGAMPELADQLDATEVEALIQYLRCLGLDPCADPACGGLRGCP